MRTNTFQPNKQSRENIKTTASLRNNVQNKMASRGDYQKQLAALVANARANNLQFDDILPDDLKEHFQDLAELKRARNCIKELEDQEKELRAERDALNMRLAQKQREIDNAPAKYQAMIVDLHQAKHQIALYKNLSEDRTNRAERYRRQLDDFVGKKQADASAAEKIEDLETRIEGQQNIIDKLMEDNRKSEIMYEQLRQSETKALRKKDEQLAKMNNELAEKDSLLSLVLQDTKMSKKSLTGSDGESLDDVSDSETLSTSPDDLLSLEEQNLDLLQQNVSLSEDNEALRDQNVMMKAALAELTESYECAKAQCDKQNALSAAVSEVKTLNRFYKAAFNVLNELAEAFHATQVDLLPSCIDDHLDAAQDALLGYDSVKRVVRALSGSDEDQVALCKELDSLGAAAADSMAILELFHSGGWHFLSHLSDEPKLLSQLNATETLHIDVTTHSNDSMKTVSSDFTCIRGGRVKVTSRSSDDGEPTNHVPVLPRPTPPTAPAVMSGAVATARPTQALRLRRESQRPGVARVVTKSSNVEDDSSKPEPKLHVYTQEAILARHRGKLPSMRVYLYPNHFRINDSQETLTYASPMREILTALREKKLPHNMLEELYASGTPFYDGCLIVEVHNYRNNTAKPKDSASGAGDGSKTAFSIHVNNNFITPSPYGTHPSSKPEPKTNGTAAQAKEAGDKDDKENVPASSTNGASQKLPASGPKITTVVLFPSMQAQLADMSILATTPATDAAALKRMQAAGRGAGMPPTPLTAVPPTPTFSAGPSPKRQKMIIDDSNVHEFEAEMLNATCPKLYLEPTKSLAESVALIDAMTHPNNKNPPPERKARKRTTAELAADEADAQNLQSFMLAGDEQQATLSTTTTGGDEGAVRAAANGQSFARFKTLASIKANHEEADRRKKEEDARQAQAKRQAQLESEAQKRRDMEANRQQAEVQEQRQQLLARQQAQQQQMLQQNQLQQNEALRAAQAAQMSNAAAAQISQTPQSATQNHFSPSVRQNTPMAAAAASPRVGGQASHPMGGTPMVATASNHAIASPARPPSSISHHPMARTASQQQGSMSRTNTPQMMQGTPVMNTAMPNRNMTPTPRMNQGSPSLQVQGATPIMMQTPQSQNMTPEQMQQMQAQQNQQRMQQMRLQQLQSQQINNMSPGAQNLQSMAMQKAQMHIQAQGIPNGQNAQLYQQRLAQGYFQQLKQAQAAQAQQQNQQQNMNHMSPQGPQNAMPNQQAANNMASMNVAQLRNQYQQRKQHLLATFGQQVPQQHVQQMHQLEQLIRNKEQQQLQAQQQMGQNQMNMNQGMQGQVPAGQNPMQMQQYQQALLQQRAQAQRNDQIMRMRQQAMQQGGQIPQGMMNNMQGMNMEHAGDAGDAGDERGQHGPAANAADDDDAPGTAAATATYATARRYELERRVEGTTRAAQVVAQQLQGFPTPASCVSAMALPGLS
ncbi:hypothetical protein OPT61_g1949 [Boeremia exigua]|uniref:Uncharacterized protein n=1 Tax=Boeremia exigua TaxID=749465 RepID=A0ACC2INE5_9PLEO|nr:hypothetical protein OPT61_g1949 [Boeremia exigua]